ncbi:MAG TPA: aldo/keto reductase, partial [Vicinamibacteria bacterium]
DLLSVVSAVASRHGVSMANVACRYVLEQEAVGGVIVGARLGQSEHIADNLRLFGFRLEPAELAELDRAADGLRAIPGDCGDEYRRPPFLTASGDLRHHLDSLPAPYPVITGRDGRSRVLTGTTWETLAGFSRAVRRGDHIFVSGTTATHRDRAVGGGDPAAQAHFVLDKIEGALQSLGSSLEDVVRTRVYVRNLADWEPVARAHGERLRHVQPANTLVQAGLVGDEYLVEMEAEALVG